MKPMKIYIEDNLNYLNNKRNRALHIKFVILFNQKNKNNG